MDMSSVSEQERQSPEAMSRSELAMFPFDKPETEDVQSAVLFELPVTASSLGLAGSLVGLEEGLEDSCLCHLEPVPVCGVKLGVWSPPSEEVRWALLAQRWLGESLGEWSHFHFKGMARSAKGTHQGSTCQGMSGKEDTGGG